MRAYVMSLTVFHDDGSFNEEGMRHHLQRMANAGLGVYVGGSGSGEAYSYRSGELRQVLSVARDEIQGKVPLRVNGLEPRTADECLEGLMCGADLVYEAAQVPGPDVGHGYKPSFDELDDYFRTVLNKSPIPVVLMSHRLLGYAVPAKLIENLLHDFPSIVGVNVATNDLRYLADVAQVCASAERPLCLGGPELFLPAAALGADGFLTTQGNLAPNLCANLISSLANADQVALMDVMNRLLNLSRENARYGNIVGIKGALRHLGLPGGYVRAPRKDISNKEAAGYVKRLIEHQALDLDVEGGVSSVTV